MRCECEEYRWDLARLKCFTDGTVPFGGVNMRVSVRIVTILFIKYLISEVSNLRS